MEENNLTAEQLAAQNAKREKIKKWAIWTGAGVAAVVAAILIWVFAFLIPGREKANQAKAEADILMQQGDTAKALAQYLKVIEMGHDAGDLAAIEAGNIYYAQGKWQQAFDTYDKSDVDDEILLPGVLSKKGDCKVNLKKYDEALPLFDEAVEECDENPQLVPYFLSKKATVLNEQKKYKEAYEIYTTIVNDYPQYVALTGQQGINIEKLQYQAKQRAGL